MIRDLDHQVAVLRAELSFYRGERESVEAEKALLEASVVCGRRDDFEYRLWDVDAKK